ncbi:hypothetical protein LBMAG52_01950 [Planctomycetia bacterium]|nr:hypothetical protein LBMAG52_01950 [Planctomycetia bacterium]
MPTRFVFRPWCLVCSLVVVFLVASERPGDARPNYKKCFDTVFKDIAKNSKTTCNVCHVAGSDDKKRLNHFGKVVAEELGEKMVKDDAKIIAAIKAAAKRKCKSGEWQERLAKGLPPCDCGDQDAGSYIARQLARECHENR